MPTIKKDGTKTINSDALNYVVGVLNSNFEDLLVGSDKRDYIRGYGGNDNLAGGSGNDLFVFEKDLAANGIDVIADFKVYTSDLAEQDVIDLSLAFGKGVKINGSNASQYIQLHDNELLVDLDGAGGAYEFKAWAIFDDGGSAEGGGYIENGDLINVRTQNFDGKITATTSGSGVIDTSPPVVTSSQVFSYAENRSAGYVIGKVLATDDIGVTAFRFENAGGTSGATSSDGFFTIGSDGTISITAAGVAANVNDFEIATNNNSHLYAIQAGDLAGNWSAGVGVQLQETDVATEVTISLQNVKFYDNFQNEDLVQLDILVAGGNASDLTWSINGSAVTTSDVAYNGTSVELSFDLNTFSVGSVTLVGSIGAVSSTVIGTAISL